MAEIDFDIEVKDAAESLKLVAALRMKPAFVDQAECIRAAVPVSGLLRLRVQARGRL